MFGFGEAVEKFKLHAEDLHEAAELLVKFCLLLVDLGADPRTQGLFIRRDALLVRIKGGLVVGE